MSAVKKLAPISVAEYLAGELISSVKHEYVDGRVYAMAGGRNVHNIIALNIAGKLLDRLTGKPCQPFNSDTKIRVPRPSERFYYPDVSVVCDPSPQQFTYQERPVVLFEVISESTRRADEGEKKDGYLSLPSLAVYALVEQDSAIVTVYRRRGNDFEMETLEGLQATLELSEIGTALTLDEIFQRVNFENDAGHA
jgi:Uma2 family endonuclease